MAIDANTGEFIPDFYFGTTDYQANWPLQQLGTRVSISVVDIKTGTKPITPIKISNTANNVNDRTVTSGIINSRFYGSSNNFTETITVISTNDNRPNLKYPSNYIYLRDEPTVYRNSPYIQQNRFSNNVKSFLEFTTTVSTNSFSNFKYFDRAIESYRPFAVAAKVDSANTVSASNLVSVVINGPGFTSRNLQLNSSIYYNSNQRVVVSQNTTVGTTFREFKSAEVVINPIIINDKNFTKPLFKSENFSPTKVSIPVTINVGTIPPKTQTSIEVQTFRNLTNLKLITTVNPDRLYLNVTQAGKLISPGKVITFDASNKNVIGTSFVTGQYTSPGSNITQGGGDYWA